MKSFAKSLAALAVSAALVFGMAACSGGDDEQLFIIPAGASGGTQSPSPVQNGEGQNATHVAYNLIIDEGIANGTVTASTASANPASKAVDGETVTLVMIADEGYELDSISVIAANGYAPQLSVIGTNKRTFEMPKQNVRVQASFKTIAPGTYSIGTPDSVAGGTVTASPASATQGETVTLEATPDTGWRLDSWEVQDAAGNPITVTDNSFTMPDGAVTINAIFVKIDYSITVESAANGSVSADKETANYGDTITLTIEPVDGYALSTLTYTPQGGEPVNVGGSGNSRTFTMPAGNVAISAAFTVLAYSVNVAESITGGSVAATPTNANVGETIVLVPTADAGWQHSAWNVIAEGGAPVTVTDNSFTMPAKNVSVSASFTKINYPITVASATNGSVSADKTTANYGDVITLTITANPGYELGELTVTSGGTSVSVDGGDASRTFTVPAGNVSVSATFMALTFSGTAYKKITTQTINGTKYAIVEFGDWPQTIKSSDVTVYADKSVTQGAFTYCKGSDGKWYVKAEENAARSDYVYSDGTLVGRNASDEKWFKVEPIKWRVLTTNYNGKKLLLAENILTKSQFYNGNGSRTINGKKVYSNDFWYSTVNAYLNGISYKTETLIDNEEFVDKGFLQTAFTSAGQAKIVESGLTSEGNYKVFLLSQSEVSKTDYGFAAADKYVGDSNGTTISMRIRDMTDYAKAVGSVSAWWLRSTNDIINLDTYKKYVNFVSGNGYAKNTKYKDPVASGYYYYNGDVSYAQGVVPALCVEN